MTNALPDGSVAVLLPAGGCGQRFGSPRNKIFAIVAGKPIWLHAVLRFERRADVGRIVMSINKEDQETLDSQADQHQYQGRLEFVSGGAERFDSVRNALDHVAESESAPDLIAIHDAARPFVPQRDLDAVFYAAEQDGSAILGAPLTGSVKLSVVGRASHIDRRGLFTALTPQVFKTSIIRDAYGRHHGFPVTDDAQLVESTGRRITLVSGSPANLKLTYPDDLQVAEAILNTHVDD